MLSSLCSRFRRVSRPRPPARHTAPKCRPGLEALDGRTLPSGTTGLHIVAAPNVNESFLNATAEVASNDVWAVGGISNPSTGQIQPLAEHFNGTSWSVVPTPTAPNGSFFKGVAAVAGNNAWAVGTTGSLSTGPLVEHWNGTSWSIVSTPSLTSGGLFNAVTATGPNDVWAAGFTGPNTLIEHFNGTAWSVVPTPAINHSLLFGISADSSTDAWAVGSAGRSDSVVEILHWNGTAWSAVTAPSPGFGSNLRSVVALAPNNVWAVGQTPSASDESLIEHFDGTSWSVVPSPNVGVGDDLTGVAAVSANNVWAVGSFVDPNANVDRTLTEHFDGTSWSVIPSPNVTATGGGSLAGVTALPSTGDVVAVGVAPLSNGQANGLILANNEPSGATPVGPASPSPTPSPSPGITNSEVIGTFTDLAPKRSKGLHKSA
jgi:hypothetical protein